MYQLVHVQHLNISTLSSAYAFGFCFIVSISVWIISATSWSNVVVGFQPNISLALEASPKCIVIHSTMSHRRWRLALKCKNVPKSVSTSAGRKYFSEIFTRTFFVFESIPISSSPDPFHSISTPICLKSDYNRSFGLNKLPEGGLNKMPNRIIFSGCQNKIFWLI